MLVVTTPQSPEQGHPQQQPDYYGQQPGPYGQQPGPYAQQPGQIPPQQWGPPPGWVPAQPPKKKRRWPWVLGAIVLLIIIVGVSGGGEDGATTTAAPAAGSDTSAAPASGEQTLTYGQEATVGDLVITASAPEKVSQPYGGDQYCSDVTYRNTGSDQEFFNAMDWKFRTSTGADVSAWFGMPTGGQKILNSGQLAPGGTTSGAVCGDQQTSDVAAVRYAPDLSFTDPVTWSK